ncbi:hypothetical protein [Flavobacterium flavigenum]|uniref:hypothetical protein n=1 Tax=Flavobacterium flavigenum TaxID=3003258 RepID=UPI0022AC1DE1|nr:hypothetical protein [Flavobacterium flavigenum]
MSELLLDKRPKIAKPFKHDNVRVTYDTAMQFKSIHAQESEWSDIFGSSKTASKNMVMLSWDTKPFSIIILDKSFTISHKLKGLYEEILISKRYLDYKDDWDDEDAVGCNPKVYLMTIELLILYAEYVLKFHDVVIKVPEISLTRDGSFDIEWRCDNRMFLMNVVNDEKLDVHFYGKDVNSTVLKGFLHDFEINRDVSHWMQKLI